VDGSATGSVNFFGPVWAQQALRLGSRAVSFHFRLPAFAPGVTSFFWALFFFLFIWIGGAAVGFGSAVCFIIGAVAGFLSFLYIRLYGEDEPRIP
jgi:hypothetical protein